MKINHITHRSARIKTPLTLALCPDFHNGNVDALLRAVRGVDAILIAGDLVDRHDCRGNGYDRALRILAEATKIAPTFYSVGNHERLLPARAKYWPYVEKSGVTVLDNRFTEFGGVVIGGLSSRRGGPDAAWLAGMAARPEFRLLLCHHPEYYPAHVAPHGIDLTLAGHAHGGQVRIFGQGLFAPGQGILPKLTSGYYFGDRLLVSRGVTNGSWAPRLFCGTELIILHLEGLNHA